ncbi:MAG: hypothetical protein DMG78_23055 [Acidobacteria bacterium]|nr:MAG: hypothetical protein DMG78_23055 [Acidobacteriota bacterium]
MTAPAGSPIQPTLSTIREAQQFLATHFPPTRLIAAPTISRPVAKAYLKLELELPTGSFKPRGALWALTMERQKRPIDQVTASSTGNHGAAVAYAAKTLGLRATIFLPANPNPVKRQKIVDLGARIVEVGGNDLAHAFLEARAYSTRPGVYFLNDATDANLPAGPATIGLEILDQLPQTRAIYVPMGDTALIRGVAAAVRQLDPKVAIVGVQAERAPSYFLSWKEGRAIPDDVVLVAEEELIDAIRRLSRERIVAEPSGAATTAAFLKQPAPVDPAVLLITGGNITDQIRKQAGLTTQ